MRSAAPRRSIRRVIPVLMVTVVLTGLVAGMPPTQVDAGTATGTLLGPGYYPRLVRLAHSGDGNGTVLATFQRDQDGVILRSTDDGATFTELARINIGGDTEIPAPGGLCCVELFEFPRQVGAFPAGTLLWAGSITRSVDPPPRRNRLGIWRSEDHGMTWVPHGACAEGVGGLWEPEFLVANDGSLICLYSDDDAETATGPVIQQELKLAVSNDGGISFGAPRLVATGPPPFGRPGMSTTAQLPDGRWAMTYELCGYFPLCQVRIKFSPDGLDWGDPAVHGDIVRTADRSSLLHTPVLSWSPFGGPQGTLLLTGQLFVDVAALQRPESGAVILVNDAGGTGPWRTAPAPVVIPDPFDHYCPNYSSPVLPLGNDAILEMATEWTGSACLVRYGTGTIPTPDPAPTPTPVPAEPATPEPVPPAFTG